MGQNHTKGYRPTNSLVLW